MKLTYQEKQDLLTAVSMTKASKDAENRLNSTPKSVRFERRLEQLMTMLEQEIEADEQ